MTKTLAYLRASTDKQDLRNQKLEILEYAREKRLHVDEFIQLTISSRKDRRQRRIEEVMEILTVGDILIVTELSRLGRSTGEVITLINELLTFGHPSSLSYYINTRKLREEAQKNNLRKQINS